MVETYPEHHKFAKDLEAGLLKLDDSNLECGQSYGVYKFQPEIGSFSACCDAALIDYNHEKFIELGQDYFDKHPELIQRKNDLRNGIKNSQCDLCWKKEAQGIKSMRQALGPTDNPLNHQNPYLDIEKSYPTRIELWMNSTCNLGCFMCHTGNSNTLRKIWHKDYDSYGNDGVGYDQWLNELDFTKYDMHKHFIAAMEKWVLEAIANPLNLNLQICYLGGEPTLHNEMFEHTDKFIRAAEKAISKGCERKISITTNGTSKDRLNERFYDMYKKYADAGWKTNIMLSNDAVGKASQVRHGADSVHIMKNFDKWASLDSVIKEVNHFTVLTNLNFPYANNLAYKIKDVIDNHYSENSHLLGNEKSIRLSFNPCIAPEWMQIRFLPKKYLEKSAKECIEVYDYLEKKYDMVIQRDVFDSVLNRADDNPSKEDVEYYFERLHYTQTVYKKTYPKWNFYEHFPHLVEFAKDYEIEIK